jgi:hypothetical protein
MNTSSYHIAKWSVAIRENRALTRYEKVCTGKHRSSARQKVVVRDAVIYWRPRLGVNVESRYVTSTKRRI